MILIFSKPVYLSLFAVIPILIFLHFIMLKRKRRDAIKFANFEALSRVQGIDLLSKNIVILILTILIISAIILAAAGSSAKITMETSSTSFVLAVDASRSMEATDFTPNRLEIAKETATDFVNTLPFGTKIGLLSFSGNAFIESDMTNDRLLLKEKLRAIPLSSIGGTDIYEAVLTGSNMLKSEQTRSIIILSDGQINVGTIDDAIFYAQDNLVVVHTIGIGTEQGGETFYGLSKLDEDALKALAHNTGGSYFQASNKAEISEAFKQISEIKRQPVLIDLTSYLILFAGALACIQYILFNTKFRIIP